MDSVLLIVVFLPTIETMKPLVIQITIVDLVKFVTTGVTLVTVQPMMIASIVLILCVNIHKKIHNYVLADQLVILMNITKILTVNLVMITVIDVLVTVFMIVSVH
jgi:hypothetical protein